MLTFQFFNVAGPRSPIVFRFGDSNEFGLDQRWAVDAPTIESIGLDQRWTVDAPSIELIGLDQRWAIDTPVFDVIRLDQQWEVDAPEYDSIGLDQSWAISSPLFDSIGLDQSWAINAFAGPPTSAGIGVDKAAPIGIRYRAVLESTAALPSLELPMSQLSLSMSLAGNWTINATIPNGRAYGAAIGDRHDGASKIGTLVVYFERFYADGGIEPEELGRGVLASLAESDNARSRTISIGASRAPLAAASGTRELIGTQYDRSSTGENRYVCAVDPSVRPGDTVTVAGQTMTARTVTWSVGSNSATMTVSDI